MLIAFLVLPGLVWVILDRGVRTGDDILYQNLAVLIHDHVVCGPRSGEWLLTIMPAKAPWLWYVGAIFAGIGRALGSVRTGLLLYPILMQVATAVLFARILALRYKSATSVRWGVLVLLAAPLYLVMSTQFWTEVNRIFVVVVFIYLLVDHARFGAIEYTLWILVACCIALLDKTTTLAYVVAPGGLIIIRWAQKWRSDKTPPLRWIVPGLLSAGLVVLTGLFYTHNLSAILDWMQHALSSDHYVVNDTWGVWHRLVYWLAMTGIHLLTPWTVVILLVIGVHHLWSARRLRLWPVAGAQVLLSLLLFLRTGNPEVRFLLPLLPYIALLTVDVARAARPTLRRLLAAAVILQFVLYQCTAFGALPFSWPFYIYQPLTIDPPPQEHLFDATRMHADPFRDAILFNTMGGPYPTNSELFVQYLMNRSDGCRSWDHLRIEDVEIMIDMASMPTSSVAGTDSVLRWVDVHRPSIYIHVDRPHETGHDGWDLIIQKAERFHTRLLQTNAYIEKATLHTGSWTIYERTDNTISAE